MNFCAAFRYLSEHPIFDNRFMQGLWVTVTEIDPMTGYSSPDPSRNTAVRILLEHGPITEDPHFGRMFTHDLRLDSWGATFEEAIIQMAELVRQYYPK